LAALWSEGIRWLFIAVGDCDARLKIALQVQEHGFRLATLCHPRAIVAADAKVGEGTLIAAGAVLGPGTIIGNQVIINTAATVDHECIIEDGVHVCPGAHLAGCVRVGRGAWIGLGTNVKDDVQVGAHSIVGAGSLVLKDIPEGVVAYGVPAKVVSPRPNYEKKPA
jgi:UDP-N-acetylbacillosamine N-acetyltransferase